MTKKIKDVLAETRQYVLFLEKRLNSQNYKNNTTPDEYQKEKQKLAKARLKLKLLDHKPPKR